jgi:penicillin-binding protein 2
MKARNNRLRFDLRVRLHSSLDEAAGGLSSSAPSITGASGASLPGIRPTLDPTLRWAALFVALVFVLLGARLVQLQALRGNSYYQQSTNNFIRERDLWPVRGQIRDRNGQVLVENRPAYQVYVTPRFLAADTLPRLRKILDLTEEQFGALRTRVEAKKGLERFKQILAAEDVSRDQMALLESEKESLPGVDVEARARRYYPHGATAAHLLGYLNQAGPEDLKRGYRIGDYVGRAGLERTLETQLRGTPGFEKFFVDAKGRRKSKSELGQMAVLIGDELLREPLPGQHAVLTIDLTLQRLVEEALAQHSSAAAAVVEVDTGKILALASHPGPDPGLLSGRMSRADAQRLERDPLRPLLDKALRESYYPGSTFKVIPALAALEERVLNPDEKITCRGRYELGRHVFRCMKAHGPVDLHAALAQSCNVYFYHLAEKVGLERMARMAHAFGLGQPTGLGLGETSGFVPTLDFYKKNGGFRGGYALNTALGQGAVRATVLQMALLYAALGNGGKLFQPMLVDRLEKPAGEQPTSADPTQAVSRPVVLAQNEPTLRALLPVSPDSLERMRRALVDVVADTKGTANSAYIEGLDLAGKSGTAQVRKNRRGEAAGWDTGNDHAWFVAYAPSRRARIAVAVLIEHGGLGGHVAAPTATRIIQGYFTHVAPEQRPRPVAEAAAPSLRTTMPTAGGAR